jgi:hypothetical protein
MPQAQSSDFAWIATGLFILKANLKRSTYRKGIPQKTRVGPSQQCRLDIPVSMVHMPAQSTSKVELKVRSKCSFRH